MILKTILHGQMTEKIALKFWQKNWQKTVKIVFINVFFTTSKNVRQNLKPILERFFLTHLKMVFKRILNGQMTAKICI